MARLVLQSQGQSGLTGTLTRVSDGTAVQLYSDVAQTITVSQPVTLGPGPSHYYFTAPATTDITAKLLNGSTVVNFLTERPSNEDQMVLTPYVPPPIVTPPTYASPLLHYNPNASGSDAHTLFVDDGSSNPGIVVGRTTNEPVSLGTSVDNGAVQIFRPPDDRNPLDGMPWLLMGGADGAERFTLASLEQASGYFAGAGPGPQQSPATHDAIIRSFTAGSKILLGQSDGSDSHAATVTVGHELVVVQTGVAANSASLQVANDVGLRGGLFINGSARAPSGLTQPDQTMLATYAGTNGLAVGTTNAAPVVIGTNNVQRAKFNADGTIVMKGIPLATVSYNPATPVLASITSTSLVDVDATNLAVTFTVPPSGAVLVELTAESFAPQANHSINWAMRNGSTEVSGSFAQIDYNNNTQLLGGRRTHRFQVTGLTPGASLTWKWAISVDGGTGFIGYGDNGTTSRTGPALIRVLAD